MLKTRNIIIILICIAFLTLILGIADLLKGPRNKGIGSNSYGTRANGFRALYELLNNLGIPAERQIEPIHTIEPDTCPVFLGFDKQLIHYEPGYLHMIRDFVKRGGTIVVSPDQPVSSVQFRPLSPGTIESRSPLEELGLQGIHINTVHDKKISSKEKPVNDNPLIVWDERTDDPPVSYSVGFAGTWTQLAEEIAEIQLPAEYKYIDDKNSENHAEGFMYIQQDEQNHKISASYPFGKGHILILSDVQLFTNKHIGMDDNAVLAVYLFGSIGTSLLFDEFYHGLTVRGNPLWLATKFPYSIIILIITASALVWAFRESVNLGPPADRPGPSRRSLKEYIMAMARLFLHARCRKFIIHEIRTGILWMLGKRLGLAPGKNDIETIVSVLKRRYPEKARHLHQVAEKLEVMEKRSDEPSNHEITALIREAEQCL